MQTSDRTAARDSAPRDRPGAHLRKALGLRRETPEEVLAPMLRPRAGSEREGPAKAKAVARESGAAGWVAAGVTLADVAERLQRLWDASSATGPSIERRKSWQ